MSVLAHMHELIDFYFTIEQFCLAFQARSEWFRYLVPTSSRSVHTTCTARYSNAREKKVLSGILKECVGWGREQRSNTEADY